MDNQKLQPDTHQSLSTDPSNLRMDEELGYIDVIPPSFGTVEYFQSQFSAASSSDLPLYNFSTSPSSSQIMQNTNALNSHHFFSSDNTTNLPSYELFGNSRFWSPPQTNVTSAWNMPSFGGYNQDRSWPQTTGNLPHYSSQHDLAWMNQQQLVPQRWEHQRLGHQSESHVSQVLPPFESVLPHASNFENFSTMLPFDHSENALNAALLENHHTKISHPSSGFRNNHEWPSSEIKDAPNIKSSSIPLGVAPKTVPSAPKSTPGVARRAPCKFFSSGGCKNGDKCPFAHEKEDQPSSRAPGRTCKYFAAGFCREGSQCPFLHPPPPSPPPQPRERSNSLNSLITHQPPKPEPSPPPMEPAIGPIELSPPKTKLAKSEGAVPLTEPAVAQAKKSKSKAAKKAQATEDIPSSHAEKKKEVEQEKEKDEVVTPPSKREKKKKKGKGKSHSDSDLPALGPSDSTPPVLIQDHTPEPYDSEADIPDLISDDEMPALVSDDEDTIEEQYQHQLLAINESEWSGNDASDNNTSWAWSLVSSLSSVAQITPQDKVIRRIAKCKDHYQVLNVTRDAQLRLIQHQYRKLATLLHANNTQTAQKALDVVTEAFSLLSDPRKRLEYDVLLQNGQGELSIQLGGDIESSLPSALTASGLRSSRLGRFVMLTFGLFILGVMYSFRVVKLLFHFIRVVLTFRSKKQVKWCQVCKEYHILSTEEGEIYEVNGQYFTRRAGVVVDVTEFIKRVALHPCQHEEDEDKGGSGKKKAKKKTKQAK